MNKYKFHDKETKAIDSVQEKVCFVATWPISLFSFFPFDTQ
jgi:hypothetical protein